MRGKEPCDPRALGWQDARELLPNCHLCSGVFVVPDGKATHRSHDLKSATQLPPRGEGQFMFC